MKRARRTVLAACAAAATAGALIPWAAPVSTAPDGRLRIGYVTTFPGFRLNRLNLATGRLLRPLRMRRPANLIAVAPNGTMAYIDNYPIGAAVAAINLTTGRVLAVVQVENYVDQIAFSRDGKHAYVAMPNAVAVIDTTREQVIKNLPRPRAASGGWPERLVVSPRGHTLYVLDQPARTLTEINTTTNSVRATLPMSVCRFAPPLSPDGRVMYVPTSDGVVPVNTTTGKPGTLARAGNCGGDLLLAPGGNTLIASAGPGTTGHPSVSRINVTSAGLKVAWTVPCPMSRYPTSMAWYGRTLFVGSSQHPVVRAVNAVSGRLGPLIRTGLRFQALDLLRSGRFVFVTNPVVSGQDGVGVINPVTMRLVRVIRPGGAILNGLVRWPGRPEVLALIGARGSVLRGWLLPISGETGRAGPRVVLGGQPEGIVFAG